MSDIGRRLRVLVIDSDLSYPPSSGKRLRTLNLLAPLARRHEITYVARSDVPTNEIAETFLRDLGIEPIIVHAPLAPKSGLRFLGRLAANLAGSQPYSVSSHTSAAMKTAVERVCRTRAFDLWQLEWSGYIYCLPPQPRPFPIVLQNHNVDALIWKRYYEVETNSLRRRFIHEQWRRMLLFERRAYAQATRLVMVSEDDARAAEKLYGPLTIDVVENGVDTRFFSQVAPLSGQRPTVLMLGALDWRPNADSIDFMLSEIAPKLRALVPEVRLLVVGRHPSPALTERLARMDWVSLHADVPDVRPYIAQSHVLAVPLRIGGGTRLKILEALAAALPVVSTKVGAEGLKLLPGRHLSIADTADALAEALASAITDHGRHRQMALAGRQEIAARHDWGMLATKLGAIWTSACPTPRYQHASQGHDA